MYTNGPPTMMLSILFSAKRQLTPFGFQLYNSNNSVDNVSNRSAFSLSFFSASSTCTYTYVYYGIDESIQKTHTYIYIFFYVIYCNNVDSYIRRSTSVPSA